ncbi:hypothetical protein ACGF0J_21885 [Nonomuraea sp. NPDC047897]|uniref:hypothetical protein n=1 Tax=Nonomuraea sp. NPDC047897 TaxID=3364346 RepID=UPI003721B79D
MSDLIGEYHKRVADALTATCPVHQHFGGMCQRCDERLAAVLAVRDDELEQLRAELEQAIAHDRQPYPTQWAYDQTCAALEKHRARAEQAERERNGWRETVERVITVAKAMREWCSPHGIVTDCADRIAEAIVGTQRPLKRGEAFRVLNELLTGDPPPGWRERAEEGQAAIVRVREVHREGPSGTCMHCSENDYPNYAIFWPCPTIRALEGADDDR